ncbi:MAG: hypothetical protein FWH31_06890 [Streptococcaceae bacterium]|nr:hypothetical protein [Streptococcaceae bacterium]
MKHLSIFSSRYLRYAVHLIATWRCLYSCHFSALQPMPFALAALAAKQTDSGATKLRRPFAERSAKHVVPYQASTA